MLTSRLSQPAVAGGYKTSRGTHRALIWLALQLVFPVRLRGARAPEIFEKIGMDLRGVLIKG